VDVRRIGGALVIAGGLLGALTLTRAGHAQDASAPSSTKSALGEDTKGIFSLENVFGFTETTESIHDDRTGRDASQSFDDKGFFPGFLGPRIGVHGVSDHITYGALFGVWWAKPVGQGTDNSGSIYTFSFSPRIGYVGTVPKQPILGYWLRTGPSFMYVHIENGGSASSSSNVGFIDWGIDAFGVVRPVDHFAILIGPSFDIAIYGKASDTNEKLGVLGLGVGLMADW
jgi:hypothetical protein